MAASIADLRHQETERLVGLLLDYVVENGIFGDIHVYGCNRGEFLSSAVERAQASFAPAKLKFFGFAPPTVSTVPQGRGNREHCTFDRVVPAESLARLVAGQNVKILSEPYADSLGLANRRHFLNEENKVALACVRATDVNEARLVLDFVEPLLLEGSVVVIEDLFAGYRRTPAKDIGRAFLEHCSNKSRYRFVPFLSAGWWGRSYVACLPTELPVGEL
jgi:hypothetical protein